MATSHFVDIANLVRAHPFVSFMLLVFLTPPFFRILLYFSPLLISTALCALAFISVGPHIIAIGEEIEQQVGGRLDGGPRSRHASTWKQTTPKRSVDEAAWLGWMEGLNPSGRAWVEKRPKGEVLLSNPRNGDAIVSPVEAENGCDEEPAAGKANGAEADATSNKPAVECVGGSPAATREEAPAASKTHPKETDQPFCKIAELQEVLNEEAAFPYLLEPDSEGVSALCSNTDQQNETAKRIGKVLEDSTTHHTNHFSDSCQLDAKEETAEMAEVLFAVKNNRGEVGEEWLLDATISDCFRRVGV